MAKIPYFPFYPDDWLSSSRIDLFTAEQERGYLRLLCRAWGMPDCTLPNDDEKLKKWSLITDADALRTLMQTVFERNAKGWINPKLYSLWIKAQDKHSKASKNASARWKRESGHANAYANGEQTQCVGNADAMLTRTRTRTRGEEEEAAPEISEESKIGPMPQPSAPCPMPSGGRREQIAQEKSAAAWTDLCKTLEPHVRDGTRLAITDSISREVFMDLGGVEAFRPAIETGNGTLVAKQEAFRSRYERREMIEFARNRNG